MNIKLITALFLGVLVVSAKAAVVLIPDLDGNFSVSTSNSTFTTWATDGGATMVGSFGTYGTGFGVQSGATASSSTSSLLIPFAAEDGYEFDTALLDLSSAIWLLGGSSSQSPAVWVYLTVGGVETKVFEWVSQESTSTPPAQYNYSGAAPDASFQGRFSTTIDLSPLVVGAKEFQLTFTAKSTWAGELGYGGAFYQDNSTPFSLTGQLLAVPEPHTAALAIAAGALLLWRRRKLG